MGSTTEKMNQPNGVEPQQAPEDQPEIPYAHPPTVDLANAQLPTQGQIDQAQTAVPDSFPDSPQAATGRPPQTASSSSAPMPSEVPVPSPPTAEHLENNIALKSMEQMQTQFQQMQLCEQEQGRRHEAQMQQQQTLIQQITTHQEQQLKRIEDQVEANASQQQQRQQQQREPRRRTNETNAEQTEPNERAEDRWGNFQTEEQRQTEDQGQTNDRASNQTDGK